MTLSLDVTTAILPPSSVDVFEYILGRKLTMPAHCISGTLVNGRSSRDVRFAIGTTNDQWYAEHRTPVVTLQGTQCWATIEALNYSHDPTGGTKSMSASINMTVSYSKTLAGLCLPHMAPPIASGLTQHLSDGRDVKYAVSISTMTVRRTSYIEYDAAVLLEFRPSEPLLPNKHPISFMEEVDKLQEEMLGFAASLSCEDILYSGMELWRDTRMFKSIENRYRRSKPFTESANARAAKPFGIQWSVDTQSPYASRMSGANLLFIAPRVSHGGFSLVQRVNADELLVAGNEMYKGKGGAEYTRLREWHWYVLSAMAYMVDAFEQYDALLNSVWSI